MHEADAISDHKAMVMASVDARALEIEQRIYVVEKAIAVVSRTEPPEWIHHRLLLELLWYLTDQKTNRKWFHRLARWLEYKWFPQREAAILATLKDANNIASGTPATWDWIPR